MSEDTMRENTEENEIMVTQNRPGRRENEIMFFLFLNAHSKLGGVRKYDNDNKSFSKK